MKAQLSQWSEERTSRDLPLYSILCPAHDNSVPFREDGVQIGHFEKDAQKETEMHGE